MKQEESQKMPEKIRPSWAVIVIIIFVVGIATGVGFVVGNKISRNQSNESSSAQPQNQNSKKNLSSEQKDDGKTISRGKCNGDERRKLGTLPMKYEDFSMILPYGLTAGNHVTPIDHQYFSPAEFNSPRDKYGVYAMADATIVDISERTNDKGTEYRFVFSISCKLFYYYDLVTSLSPNIKAEYEKKKRDLKIPVKEGQLVGHIGGQTLDFAVWDIDEQLSGYVVAEHYKGEAWKIHTVDPLNYYTDELKQKVLSKYVRTTEPRSGKIDYDIDGKLIGNWFVEGSGGYAPEGKWQNYWTTHLSIAPDAFDPESIVVSIGDFGGDAKQFGIKGNAPNPAEVDDSSGMIKYELVQKDWADETGKQWDRKLLAKGIKAKNKETSLGIALVQMIEKRKVKVEVFPGKATGEVSDFTTNAKIYER